jgi:hypothetical protein
MKESSENEVDLNDAELIGYEKRNSELYITISLWNEKKILFSFFDVVRILDNDCNTLTLFNIEKEETNFLRTTLKRVYEKEIPEKYPYQHFKFLDLDGEIGLEIISSSYRIEKLK